MRNKPRDFGKLLFTALALALIFTGNQCSKTSEIPVTTSSKEARSLFTEARELGENLHLDRAVSLLTEALEEDPEFALAYLYLARFAEEPRELRKNLQRAVELASNTSPGEQLLINAYQAYYGEDNPGKAKGFLEQLTKMHPRDKRARLRLGVFCQISNKPETAVQELNRAIALDKDFAPPYLTLGYTFMDNGEDGKAREAFQNYIRLIPDQPNPYDSMGDLYSLRGDYQKAIDHYYLALEKDPEFPDSQEKIGTNLVFLGKYQEGRDAIVRAMIMKRTPEGKAENMSMLVRSYIYEQNYPQALIAADEAIRYGMENNLTGEVVASHLAKSAVHLEMGNLDLAEQCIEICRNICDNSEISAYFRDIYSDTVFFWEAFIAARRKDFEKAIRIANQYRDSLDQSENPERMKFHDGLMGLIELERGYPDIAREYFRYANIREPLFMYYAALAEKRAGSQVRASRLFRETANWNRDGLWYAFVRHKARARK